MIEREAAWAVLEEVSGEVRWEGVHPILLRLAARHRAAVGAPGHDDQREVAFARYYERVVTGLDAFNTDVD